jgi:hypothetical protein
MDQQFSLQNGQIATTVSKIQTPKIYGYTQFFPCISFRIFFVVIRCVYTCTDVSLPKALHIVSLFSSIGNKLLHLIYSDIFGYKKYVMENE